jgi:hypothetical protein
MPLSNMIPSAMPKEHGLLSIRRVPYPATPSHSTAPKPFRPAATAPGSIRLGGIVRCRLAQTGLIDRLDRHAALPAPTCDGECSAISRERQGSPASAGSISASRQTVDARQASALSAILTPRTNAMPSSRMAASFCQRDDCVREMPRSARGCDAVADCTASSQGTGRHFSIAQQFPARGLGVADAEFGKGFGPLARCEGSNVLVPRQAFCFFLLSLETPGCGVWITPAPILVEAPGKVLRASAGGIADRHRLHHLDRSC